MLAVLDAKGRPVAGVPAMTLYCRTRHHRMGYIIRTPAGVLVVNRQGLVGQWLDEVDEQAEVFLSCSSGRCSGQYYGRPFLLDLARLAGSGVIEEVRQAGPQSPPQAVTVKVAPTSRHSPDRPQRLL
ncbi:MAG: hypothetical protein JWM64_247 [Frankiales bacterium]|nr:hypothetical protein [Frankiales bacterium]